MNDPSNPNHVRRWRLILGKYSAQELGAVPFRGGDLRLEQALDFLYGREYDRKGHVGGASLDPSAIQAVDWLRRIRKVFPRDVFEKMQAQAVERYGLTDLLQDPKTLACLEPNQALAGTLLALRGRLRGDVLDAVREIIRTVVEEITRRIRGEFVNAVTGRRNRFRRSQLKSARNFDWRATIRENLKHYDAAGKRLMIERPRFNARVKRSLPWDVILCVDQSGSMLDSVMYSAVVAGILSTLPAVSVHLVVFDTSVVDLSHLAHDPVEVLLTVRLGGGTDIGRAVAYCERLIRQPSRTVFALVSDFCEGASVGALLAAVRRMAEARVTLIGLAALDEEARPVYDHATAQRLAGVGMHVAALTPVHFAEWLAGVMA